MIKNEKDGIIIDMKVKGCSNKEIALTTNTPIKTIGNLISRGGRLYPALQSLRQTKEVALIEHNQTAWDNLLAAKNPSIEELKRLSLESPNDVARLKAIDMILELTGIRDEDRPPLLDPYDMMGSLDKLGKWINQKALKTYQDKAPNVTFEFERCISGGGIFNDPKLIEDAKRVLELGIKIRNKEIDELANIYNVDNCEFLEKIKGLN